MEERKINYPTNRRMKRNLIRKGALGLAMALTLSVTPAPKNMVENVTTVEAAKKDKKKPKITLKGQKTLTVEEGEKVTIPKTTYSDNKTKKKKLKVGVTVKKEKKSYKTIANKIKKATLKSKPVAVEFPEDGTYKITTTVTDLAKNKATAVRTVVVNEKDIVIDDQQIDVKEDPITEEPTRKVVTPEIPTTTEEPKKEEKIDLSAYADYETVEINDNDYNVVTKLKKEPEDTNNVNDLIYLNYSNIPFENAYLEYPIAIGVGENSEYANEKYLPLYLIGKIKTGFIHEHNNTKTFIDLSDNVLLDYIDQEEKIKIYVVDENNNFYYIQNIEYRNKKFAELNVEGRNLYGFDNFNDYSINTDSQVITAPGLSSNEITIKTKKLTLNKIDLGKSDD